MQSFISVVLQICQVTLYADPEINAMARKLEGAV
jgi:hypothetical protein